MNKTIIVDEETHRVISEIANRSDVPIGVIIRAWAGLPVVYDGGSARSNALTDGEKFYQGEPCEYGHDGERYTKSGQCVQCARVRSKIKKLDGESFATRVKRLRWFDQGEKQYFSNDVPGCSNCGQSAVTRWVKTGLCINCYTGDGKRIR
jgi:hypothetical protein